MRLERATFRWIAEDTVAAEKGTVIAATKVQMNWSNSRPHSVCSFLISPSPPKKLPITMSRLTAYCSLPRAWPQGAYRVDFVLGDDHNSPCTSVHFTVVAKSDQLESVNMFFQRTPESRKHGFIDVFSPDAGELSVVFTTLYKCNVREDSYICWLAVDVPGSAWDPNHELLKCQIEPCEANVFTSNCALPIPWPVGSYACELVIDGVVLERKRLECVDDYVSWEAGKFHPLIDY